MKGCYKKPGNCFAPLVFCLLFAAVNVDLGALEISRGLVRLSLHEQSGRFSLYGMNNDGRFEPFFSDEDPRTSFIELYLDKRLHRLGDASAFRFHMEIAGDSPAIVFESGNLEIREEFSFITTPGSPVQNGIQLNIRVRNRGQDEINPGLRLVLDTVPGEDSGKTPFFLNGQEIPAETLTAGTVGGHWVSRGPSLSVMGSIGRGQEAAGGEKNPDYLRFANWKRLSETSWQFVPGPRRNFDYPPYSFNDAAVCYYYDPGPLPRYGEANYVIMLAIEDPAGFVRPREAAANSGPSAGTDLREADLALLQSLTGRMDYYLEGKIAIPDAELAAMEETIARLKARYNIP